MFFKGRNLLLFGRIKHLITLLFKVKSESSTDTENLKTSFF